MAASSSGTACGWCTLLSALGHDWERHVTSDESPVEDAERDGEIALVRVAAGASLSAEEIILEFVA